MLGLTSRRTVLPVRFQAKTPAFVASRQQEKKCVRRVLFVRMLQEEVPGICFPVRKRMSTRNGVRESRTFVQKHVRKNRVFFVFFARCWMCEVSAERAGDLLDASFRFIRLRAAAAN